MRRSGILALIVCISFIAIFNVWYFVAMGTDHPASAWISYAFVHVALIAASITPYLSGHSEDSYLFGSSLSIVSSLYVLAELVVGIIFICLKPDNIAVALLIQLALLVAFVVVTASQMHVNQRTQVSRQVAYCNEAFASSTVSRLKVLVLTCNDPAAKERLERLYNKGNGMTSKSSPQLQPIENSISYELGELERAVASGNGPQILQEADKIENLIAVRSQTA